MSTVAFRPRSMSEIIDASVRIARAHYAQLAMLSAIAFLPSILNELTLSPQPEQLTPGAFGGLFAYGFFSLLSLIWYVAIDGAMIHAISDAYLGRAIDSGGVIKRAFKRWGALIGLGIVRYLIAMIPVIPAAIVAAIAFAGGQSAGAIAIVALVVIAAVVGAIYLYLVFVLAPPALLLEGVGVAQSLTRSRTLTSGKRGAIFGLFTLLGLMLLAVAVTGMLLAGIVTSNQLVIMAVWQIIIVLLYPIIEAIVVVLYYDMRIRKEGYDIELMARELEGAPATPVA